MLPYRRGMTILARDLRRNMTDAERFLWSKLRRRQLSGACFYRQRIIGEYIADFYCKRASLVIELDGGRHFHGEVKKKDAVRDAFFKNHGLRVLRFANDDVLKNTQAVLEEIFRAVT